ncbi:MAG: FHA domain-containing protein [bacterium]
MVVLIKLFDGVAIKEFPIDKPLFSIGRHPDNDICIDDQVVSKKHAVIECEEDPYQNDAKSYYIKDLESLNSTYVNGIKITHQKLNNNDLIRIGLNTFKFFNEDINKADQTLRISKDSIPEVSDADNEVNDKDDPFKLPNEKIDGLKQIYNILIEALKRIQELIDFIESHSYIDHKISIDHINNVKKIIENLSHYYASNSIWIDKQINDKINGSLSALNTIYQNMALFENKELKDIDVEFKEDWKNLLNDLHTDFEILIKYFKKDLMIEIPFLRTT